MPGIINYTILTEASWSSKKHGQNILYVSRRGGTTQTKPLEITYEQIQKELGLGVGGS